MLPKLVYTWKNHYGPRSMKGFKQKLTLADAMQWWPAEKVRDWQWLKLKELLDHAQRNVPYYRRLFADLGIDKGDIRGWDDFARLPILTKEDIQRNRADLLTPGASAVENQTGGSTGQPLRFYEDAEYLEWAAVSRAWGFGLCGFKGGEKQVFLWGSDYDSQSFRTLEGRFWNYLHNIEFINAFDITDQRLKQIAHRLSRSQPDYIWGYASTLGLLADQLAKEGLELRPRGVQTTAGTLYPSLRSKLEDTFGQVVYDRYGSREVSIIAHECSAHHGLHIFSPHNYVEIVDGGATGLKDIIVTNLHNQAFPFIRYRIGDLALTSATACECGRTLPLLERVVGRSVEIITSPSGKLIDGEFFTHLFYKVKGVRRFCVIQEKRDVLVVKIVRSEEFSPDALSFLSSTIKQYGDPDFEIKFEFVEQIPPLRSGKMVFVRSNVPIPLR